MVVSKEIYSPQNYLEAITDNCYIIRGGNDIEFIERVLRSRHMNLWNYPLNEIDHIVENDINVVLVDCMVYNEETNEYIHEYRWFEVPNDFKK